MSANIKDTLKKKVNQAQNKAIFNKYGTPDVVATIKGKKVEYGNQIDNKKAQNNNRPKKSAVQTLSSTKKAQVTQQQKAKSKLGTDKKGYTVTDSNKVMQNYANKTGSYDVNKYKKDTFDKQREQQEKAKKIVNNIKKRDTLNSATKKAGQAAKNTGKFLTDFDYRNKVGEKALMGAGTALSQFSKGALKTVENWGDAARSATDDFNNWVAYKTGIIDKKEYDRQRELTRESIAADAVGDFWKNNLGWNEENAQALKDYSYVTEDNLLGQLAYGVGQQAPALMIGNTQAVQNLMTNPALQSVAGDGAVKNIARGLIRNAPMNAEIGLRSYGGAVEEALQNGATMEQARRYGLLNAGTEIATEWMTGGIPGVENTTGLFDKGVDALIDKTTGKLTKETSKAIAKSLLSYGFDALGEGLEESVSEIFSPLIKNMTYSNGEKIDWNSVLNAGIMGMLQGGILNAPSAVTNARNDIRQARQTDRANQEAARQQAEQQARQELNTAAQSRLNEVYQQNQENTPIFNQQNRMMELAQQQVQAINQQVQSGQISPQEGIQQIENIQRYITAQQNAQMSPTANETQQSNVIGQQQQNIAQNANNEVAQNQQQSSNLVQDYINDNYENMVEDYIDQNYGQQQENNLVEDYMNNGEDNLVNDYMNNYEDGNVVENFMNAQSELQQAQQDNIKQQSNAFNLGKNETKLPTNTDDKIQNFRNSVKNENVKDADGFYKAVEKIISDKDYNVVLDSSIKNKQGRAVNALITNENGITIKINPNSNRAAEILLMHEVTHGIETKEMSNLIMDYASKNSEFNEALESLKKAYGTNDVTSEVVADISGQLFGNQEFINNLSTEKPGVFKRIYNKIVELANKLTGNSKQALFIRDLKNKWETAYREANIESSQIKLKDQVKYSQDGEITDNKGRELNINMQNYMEDSQATDDKGQLVTLYHTTTDMIKQFNVFDPANKYDGNYKFGKNNVTYLTDNQEMSGSYSQYDYRKANTKRLNSIEEANKYLDYNSSLRIIDIENTNQAIKNHFEGNPNRYFLVSGDLTTFGEYKTEQELLRDVIPTSQWVMRGNSNFQYEVYANITKPFIIDAEGRNWDNIAREIVQEYKDVVDNLSQEQKEELAKYAEDSINKYSDWAMSEKYTEYLKYNDEYKMLDNTTEENLVLLSFKENATPQDYIDMYNEFGKEGKSPDSKITVDGEEMTFAEFAARWCNLEMENAKYAYAYSYFLTQANKQYRNQLQQVGVERMFDMAKYGFRDWAVEDNLSRILKTNDIVNKVIEMNENGEDYDGVIIKNTTDYGPGYVEERTPHDVYVVFNSNQIKSVDNPDPTNDPDIRYSEKAKQWQDFLEKNYKNTGTTTKLNEKIGTEKKQTEVPQTQRQQRETKAEPVVKVDLTGEKGKEYFIENGADEKVAQILSEKHKQKTNKLETAKEAAGQTYRLLVSKGGEIERISKITNRPDVKYKYDKAMRAMSEAQQHIGSEQTDLNYKPYKNFTNVNGEKVSMSLNDIRKDAKKNNIPEQTLNEYLAHNLNVDRYMEDKPVFGKSVTSDDSLKRIAEIEQEHPEIKRIAQNVWAYEHNELKNAYDAGLIDEEFYNDLAKNEHYVRIQRNVERKGSNAAILGRDGKISVNQGIQTAKGGNQDILPIMEGIAKYTTEMVRNERVNESVKSLAESISMGSQDDTIQSIEDEESFGFNPEVFKANDDGTYTMTFFDKGKATVVPINKAIYDAYVTNKYISAAENALPTRALTYLPKKASSMFRTLTTDKNPMFMVTNFFKDIGDAPFNSKYAKEFAKEFATTNAHRQVITNGGYNKLYNRAGGDSDSYFTEGEFKDKTQSKVGKVAEKLLTPIEKGNQIIEAGPRMAEFIATIKANGYDVNSDGEMVLRDSKKANGRTAESVLDEALYNAAEITTNFKRGGDLSKMINRNGGTFFNASIQGFDKQIRNFKDAFTDGDKKKVIGLLVKALIFGVAPTMLNEGMNDDDDEYKNMQDYLKDNYYLFKGKDGNYIRIPKGRAMSVIGSAYRRTKDYASGNKDAFKEYAKFASGQVAPNNPFENNIIAPFFAVKNNKSWSGSKIVSQSMEKRPAAEQYNEKTDKFSKWLGGKINVSPMKINYLIDQYTGGIGDVALPMITPKATSKSSNPLVQPFVSKFTTDSVYQQKSVGDFYDAMSAAETKKYSVKATKEDKVKYSYLYSQNQKMAELYKEQRAIQADENISKKEKYEQAREIQKEINKLAEESVKNSNNIKDHKYYATIGDNTYYLTTDNDGNDVWAKDGYADSHKASADKKGVALYDYYKEKYEDRKTKKK